MSVCYGQLLGSFNLGLGFNNKFINKKFNLDMGERFHKDPDYRISTFQEIDRQIFNLYGKIGLGFKNPSPRLSVEPFGHRFMPAMYGCSCRFAEDSEPWAEQRFYSDQEILSLKDLTREDYERSTPVQETVRQAEYLHNKYGNFYSLPNLGSTINTAISLRGNQLFVDYLENPSLLKKFYRHINELMKMTIEYFERVDCLPAEDRLLGLGNCTVAMISPQSYQTVNMEFDLDFRNYLIKKGVQFGIHQDSNVTPQIENYAKFPTVNCFDVGMDTDFGLLAEHFSCSAVNCIWFPQWILNHSLTEIEEEVSRLMRIGTKFKKFSFTFHEIDKIIPDEKLFFFYGSVVKTAERYYKTPD